MGLGEGEWISLAGIRGATLVRHSSSVARCAVDVWGFRAKWHILVSVTYTWSQLLAGAALVTVDYGTATPQAPAWLATTGGACRRRQLTPASGSLDWSRVYREHDWSACCCHAQTWTTRQERLSCGDPVRGRALDTEGGRPGGSPPTTDQPLNVNQLCRLSFPGKCGMASLGVRFAHQL